jgi:hypothetical protein
MNVLSDVLNILSEKVGADGDSVPADTSKMQRKRNREAEEDKDATRKFREDVGNALAGIAATNKIMVTTQRLDNLNRQLTAMREARSIEEDKMVKFEMMAMEVENCGDTNNHHKYLMNLVEVHKDRIAEYTKDIANIQTKMRSMEALPSGSNNNSN